MSSSSHPPPPGAQDNVVPQGTTVRRHHTITAASRTARAQAKDIISEETSPSEQVPWNDDELVDQDWVGGVGAVGEKTSLHRQSSLPTRYHRGFHGSKAANQAPKTTINSLAAIAGHEGDEEPWNIANEYQVQDDEQHVEATQQLDPQSTNSPLASHFNQPVQVPSPPPAGSGVRRHVSLTYGAAVGGPRKVNAGLKRSGTLQATHSHTSNAPEPSEYHQEGSEYSYDQDDVSSNQAYEYTAEEEAYLLQQAQQQHQQQQQYGGGVNRSTPWNQSSDWRTAGNANTTTIDDVQRALSTLEIASAAGAQGYAGNVPQYPSSQSAQPPRFTATPSRGSNNGNGGNIVGGNGNKGPVDYDGGRRTPSRTQNNNNWQQQQQRGDWDQQQSHLGGRRSNSNLQYQYQQGGHSKASSGSSGAGNIPAVPPIPSQYLQQQQGYGQQQQQQSGRPGLGVATNFTGNGNGGNGSSGQTPVQQYINTPIDVPTLIAAKGYNPQGFDIKPGFARYFVIKSYTEDDVHKSLKYEIWSSTEPGNKRLDKAFKDTGGRGPIYLFFSVNASGHFCGMAEMLTPVDYTRSSTVWASDKWKGVFKVRWIFVRDIPNSNLRHIKLNNTQERKPVTNSRDTQELLPDAGQEMLRIFHTHPARTSLLQDFAFYELQAMQKQTGAPAPTIPTIPSIPNSVTSSPPNSLVHSPQVNQATIPSSSASSSSHTSTNSFSSNSNQAYQNSPYNLNPMMQLGMGIGGMGGMGITASPTMGLGMQGGMNMGQMGMGNMGMGMGGVGGGGQFGVHSQTHQAVMRHSSPAPSQGQGHNQGQSYGY
ncbi:hypothetical protein D9611_004857 [Ephemerocybe angulata]|uniref:YTH domain-containing protein n=1 Tax=Ephemerocybe angulata TaxID=980116 RepID=A0A8H5EX61_9AGAR|nr:hypothetical protein D9611_004857 [Tulosesus angulatus]